MSVRLYHGDMRDVLATYDAETIDAVVTDPPYELGFMGKRWDASGVSFDPETWRACYRVLKPGGHLLAFGGTRTVHRIAVAIEDAGFEIRDQIAWLFGSGFPKSHNLGNGYGTALKPAMEPIVVARKPLIGTVAANVTEYGTGALNIDGCRIGTDGGCKVGEPYVTSKPGAVYSAGLNSQRPSPSVDGLGRWPANVALDEEAATMLDAQSGERGGGYGVRGKSPNGRTYAGGKGFANTLSEVGQTVGYGDTGGASRFFYVAKASRAERNAGLDGMPERSPWTSFDGQYAQGRNPQTGERTGEYNREQSNYHPTVKPIALMRWLVRLVTPPDGAVILDPFLGSGTTGIAAVMEDVHFVGIEQSAEYLEIARRRIAHAQGPLFAQVSG